MLKPNFLASSITSSLKEPGWNHTFLIPFAFILGRASKVILGLTITFIPSINSGNSSIDLYNFIPSIESYLGFIP